MRVHDKYLPQRNASLNALVSVRPSVRGRGRDGNDKRGSRGKRGAVERLVEGHAAQAGVGLREWTKGRACVVVLCHSMRHRRSVNHAMCVAVALVALAVHSPEASSVVAFRPPHFRRSAASETQRVVPSLVSGDDNSGLEANTGEGHDELSPVNDGILKPRRRRVFLREVLSTSGMAAWSMFPRPIEARSVDSYFSLRNNNNIPYASRGIVQKQQQDEFAAKRRKLLENNRKKYQPFSSSWKTVEQCLFGLLPVKNATFRKLQGLIEDLKVRQSSETDWSEIRLEIAVILSYLDSKRSSLEPVFNQDDPTELYISKSSLGERNIEELRSKLEKMAEIAEYGEVKELAAPTAETDISDFVETKRQALFALAELGELLVPSFPFAVPTQGKFSYLPRLLGRCRVTFTFERSSTQKAFGVKLGDGEILGNVTIIADGYAAPITAGNFVDLAQRNFYNGLSVKSIRKRLGLVPTSSDNVIVNDLQDLKDGFDDFAADLDQKTALSRQGKSPGGVRELVYDETRMSTDAVLPILGSFNEGFYDPLTAKPRRIPLEVVALDASSPYKSTLTYSSSYAPLDEVPSTGNTKYSYGSSSAQRSFSSATTQASSNSTATSFSNLDPVLSFDIPDLVALNHPDRFSNGGSSEFFAVPRKDGSRFSKLLDGQYAPFGYITAGADVYNSLKPGDVIKTTQVSEVGLLNLVKIRKNAFEGDADQEEGQGEDEVT